MTVHELKTWPAYFERLVSGEKTFEVRKDDRGFQAGDELRLREFDPSKCSLRVGCLPNRCPAYTGRELKFTVGFVYRQGAGLDCGEYAVLSLQPAPMSAGVGPDTDIEGLAVAELRQERDEALAEVARLAAELERWPTALTVDGTTGDGQ